MNNTINQHYHSSDRTNILLKKRQKNKKACATCIIIYLKSLIL